MFGRVGQASKKKLRSGESPICSSMPPFVINLILLAAAVAARVTPRGGDKSLLCLRSDIDAFGINAEFCRQSSFSIYEPNSPTIHPIPHHSANASSRRDVTTWDVPYNPPTTIRSLDAKASVAAISALGCPNLGDPPLPPPPPASPRLPSPPFPPSPFIHSFLTTSTSASRAFECARVFPRCAMASSQCSPRHFLCQQLPQKLFVFNIYVLHSHRHHRDVDSNSSVFGIQLVCVSDCLDMKRLCSPFAEAYMTGVDCYG